MPKPTKSLYKSNKLCVPPYYNQTRLLKRLNWTQFLLVVEFPFFFDWLSEIQLYDVFENIIENGAFALLMLQKSIIFSKVFKINFSYFFSMLSKNRIENDVMI